MWKNRVINASLFILALVLCSGCYKEQHFSVPGPYQEESWGQDSMPFPFQPGKTGGIYLIRSGAVDYRRIATQGFTDFVPEIDKDQYSWYEGVDRHGDHFFGSRQHKNFYQMSDEDNFGGLKLSYQGNDLYAKPFLQIGQGKKWHFYAKMALATLGHDTRSGFVYEGNNGWDKRAIAGFDRQYSKYSNVAANPQFFFYREKGTSPILEDRFEPCFNMGIIPGEPFDYELVSVNGFTYCKINGTTIWMLNLASDNHARPMRFTPWMNAVHFYDMYIEGDYSELNVAAFQHEQEYATIQAPALTKDGSDLLLFAEGRKENIRQESIEGAKRSNATDIILKRSGDAGDHWDDLTVIAGGDGSVNMRPCVITAGDGTINLFYTVDNTGKQEDDYTIYLKKSQDGGRQWSQPEVVECNVAGYVPATISGHGIRTVTGRLIIPLRCTYGRTATVAVLYSDDEGVTWEAGNPVAGFRNRYANLVETGGQLVMYIGHNGAGKSRKVVYSADGGINWTDPVDATINTGTEGYVSSGATVMTAEGKIVHFSANGFVSANDYALTSSGTSLNDDLNQRKEMYIYRAADFSSGLTIQSSSDNGITWSVPESMLGIETYKGYKFLTGNMDAVLLDNTVICVCEGGVAVPYEGLLCFKKNL